MATKSEKTADEIDRLAREVESSVIEWRHDIHRNPELSHREFRTSKRLAGHLKKTGMELQTGVAHTGVIGILRGRADGPVVFLRADMDALPVMEETGAPCASVVSGMMHACRYDSHTAILTGGAQVLSRIRDRIPGTGKLIFQPAQEGIPAGEEGGAALENPKVDAIFGLNVVAMPVMLITGRAGA